MGTENIRSTTIRIWSRCQPKNLHNQILQYLQWPLEYIYKKGLLGCAFKWCAIILFIDAEWKKWKYFYSIFVAPTPSTTPAPDDSCVFRCLSDAQCVRKMWICDGFDDCEDKSDESPAAGCPSSTSCFSHTSQKDVSGSKFYFYLNTPID